MKGCELCRLPAKICCEADGANLCWECDEKVHCANFLVAKHSRNLLCHVCQSPTPWRASGPKLGPTTTASVCDSCVHKYCHSSIYAKHENISGAQQSHPPPLNENHDHDLHLHLHLQDGINHTTSTDHQYYEEYDEEDSEVEYGDHDDDEDEDYDDDDDQEMEEEGENQVVPLSSCSTPPPPLIPTSSSTSEDHLSSCISVRLNAHDPDYQDEVGSYSSRFNNSVSYVASEEEKANSLSTSRPLKIRRTNYEMIQED